MRKELLYVISRHFVLLWVCLLGFSFFASPVSSLEIREKLVGGKIVALDSEQNALVILSRDGSEHRLEVDPYVTVIWKKDDYVDGLDALHSGDQIQAGYFMEVDRNVAGWIDVLDTMEN